MESGVDPEIRKYFRKIVHSFSFGFLWLAANVTVGIYFGFAWQNGRSIFFTYIFYLGLLMSLLLLLRYYYRIWKK